MRKLTVCIFAMLLSIMGCSITIYMDLENDKGGSNNHSHSFSSRWTQGEETHYQPCDCGAKKDEAAHDWKVTVIEAAAKGKDGRNLLECSVCYKSKMVIVPYDHKCSFDGWVTSDSEKHWKECECGEKSGESAHKFEWVTTDNDSHWKECECGKRIEEGIHRFIYNGNSWQQCECGKNEAVSLEILGFFDSTKMTFGVYPQTIKADSVTVDKTVKNTEITGTDYYLGSDGAWYAECVEDGYDSVCEYSDGSLVNLKSLNSVKYFKVEPIEWVYLAETKCLHAKKILTANVQWHASSNNYANSNIRSWLNGTFYNSAFTESQKEKIKTTTVDNSVASTGYSTNIYACEDTNDKVYLLSYKEANRIGNRFYSDADRIRFPTDYALANYCNKYIYSSYGGWWWLRSPNYNYSYLARDIDSGGDGDSYIHYNFVDARYGGVVPALSISE